MSYTLKVLSRMIDEWGLPRTQVWWPGVRMVSRVACRPLDEVEAGCWADYGAINIDYVRPNPPMMHQARAVRPGMIIRRDIDGRAEPWRVRSITSSSGIVTLNVDSVTAGGDIGESVPYDQEVYVELWNQSSEIRQFNPNVTLLWVTLEVDSVYMLVEQAYLLGPDGGTIDRLCS